MSTTRYQRRPERPRLDLDEPAWNERIDSIRMWIKRITESTEPLPVQVGAIWGPRGSGKTSLLRSLLSERTSSDTRPLSALNNLHLPSPDAEAKQDTRQPARSNNDDDRFFQPDLIDDDKAEDLFAHLLTFIRRNYGPLREAKGLESCLKILAEQSFRERFLNYDKDIATSSDDLLERLYERLRDQSTFSQSLRKRLHEAIATPVRAHSDSRPSRSWYLLLIDDIDLVPHRGPELLSLIHTYLRDLPFIVILAADREQLVAHTAVHLARRHGREDRSLALQTLAKQIPYEWPVPQPTSSAALDDFYDRAKRTDMLPGEPLGPTIEAALKRASTILQAGWIRYQAQRAQDSEPDTVSPWGTRPEEYPRQFIPRNWRAINRAYNRLATRREELDIDRSARNDLVENLGIRDELLTPFLTIFAVLDAHIPELALADALERDPGEFHRSLAGHLHNESHERVPLDRLRPPWLDGRMISHARELLVRFTTAWDIMRAASTYVDRRVRAVYAFSVVADAFKELSAPEVDLAGLFPALEQPQPYHIDKSDGTTRPDAARLRQLIDEPDLRDDLSTIPPYAALYPRAPLSLVAWLGWYLRQRPGHLVVLGLFGGLLSPYSAASSELRRDADEPSILQRPIALTFPGDAEDAAAPAQRRLDEAFILLDIRPNSDSSSRALPLWSIDQKPVYPEHTYKLASNPGFQITPENLHDILTDVLWLFRSLRDERGITRFHLALATSAPLAFFVGREIHGFIPIDLYEHDPGTSSYRFVTTLE